MKKETIIKKIKSIIKEHGEFTTGELQCDCSPCINSMGGLVTLAERFNEDDVDVEVCDSKGNPINDYSLEYEEIDKEVLEEILELAEQWEVDCDKTMKRCED